MTDGDRKSFGFDLIERNRDFGQSVVFAYRVVDLCLKQLGVRGRQNDFG